MDRTVVTKVGNHGDEHTGCDVMSRSDKRIKVVLDESDVTLMLTKATAAEKWYTTVKFGMTFQTTGF